MELFFSYSHVDEALRDQLEIHLSIIKRQGLIDAWHDRRILAGDTFDGQISAHLETAEIILLLVSPDFLNSDYCYNIEMHKALERHKAGLARVIPVILRPCDWKDTPFGLLLAFPTDGKPITRWPDRDEAFLNVVEAIKRVIKEMSGKSTKPAPVLPSQPSVIEEVQFPRSSNLRVAKQFTDQDRDTFLEKSYEFIEKFFEASLQELKRRNPELETRFRKIDATHFHASIYRNGSLQAQCKIWMNLRGGLIPGIGYSNSPTDNDNSYNEIISVANDKQQLYLKPMGLGTMLQQIRPADKMTQEGGAEHLWSMFIERLQN